MYFYVHVGTNSSISTAVLHLKVTETSNKEQNNLLAEFRAQSFELVIDNIDAE